MHVGDRVRCIEDGGNAGIHTGHEYVISHMDNEGFVRVNGTNNWYLESRFIVLEEPEPVADNRQSIPLYTIVYQYNGQIFSQGFPTQQVANEKKVAFDRSRSFTVLAMKKITVRI